MSAYEELYAKLWQAQARKEGHKPGFPEHKEKFVAHIALDKTTDAAKAIRVLRKL